MPLFRVYALCGDSSESIDFGFVVAENDSEAYDKGHHGRTIRRVLIDYGYTDEEAEQEELDTMCNALGHGEGWFLTVEELAAGCGGAAEAIGDELFSELVSPPAERTQQ